MANFKDIRAAASRLRWATESLTDPHDQALVRDYLRELDAIAGEEGLPAGSKPVFFLRRATPFSQRR